MKTYIFHITSYDLATVAALFIGLALSLQLAFVKSINSTANRFLSLALIAMILGVASLLLQNVEMITRFKYSDQLPFLFAMVIGPLSIFTRGK